MKRILLLIVMALTTQTIKAQTVTIGTQTWTTKNLDVSTYRDGTPIPEVTDPTEWANLTTGAWCYYNNDPLNGATYGKLYNWYAVAGIWNETSKTDTTQRKQLAPTGYHVSSDTEWTTLIDYLGGEDVAGKAMKETGEIHWDTSIYDLEYDTTPFINTGSNSSGFTALGGGRRWGGFGYFGADGHWWSSSEIDITDALSRALYYESGFVGRYDNLKSYGFSVRCLRDETLSNKIFEANSFKIYPNPAKASVTIECDNPSNIANQPFTIIDALGKIVLKGILNEGDNSINVEQLSKGIYYVKIANNKASRFIKE